MFKDKTTLLELNRLCSEIQITNTQIVFREKLYAVLPEQQLTSLTNILYSECYALKEVYQSGFSKRKQLTLETDSSFVTQLSQYNFTTENVDHGWYVKQNLSNGYFDVIKGTQQKTVHLSEFRNSNTIEHTHAHTVSIFLTKEDKNRQPTFYYAFSNKSLDLDKNITRVYFNINSQGAAPLLEAITKTLNTYKLPFLFKCLNHPDLYFRRDAAVLYIDSEHMPVLKLLLPEICDTLRNTLDEDVPLFTFKYSKGVGIAESPANNESFGMHRVELLAKSLLNTAQNKRSNKSKLEDIVALFLKEAIHPEMPFLNKGSKTLF